MTRPDRAPTPRCEVCREALGATTAVRCARCETPHHQDCWEFVGRCSVYACGSAAYRDLHDTLVRPSTRQVIASQLVSEPLGVKRASLGAVLAVLLGAVALTSFLTVASELRRTDAPPLPRIGSFLGRLRDPVLEPLGRSPRGVRRWRNLRDGAEMLLIDAGGATPPFLISRYEVTVAQYERFRRTTGREVVTSWREQLAHPLRPVAYANWDQARAYAAWVGGRLPSPREWELAAGGGDGRRYPWGDREPTMAHTRFGLGLQEGDRVRIHHLAVRLGFLEVVEPIGSHPAGASPFGAEDMGGNLSEWCAGAGRTKPVRGSSWWSSRAELPLALPRTGDRFKGRGDLGFRVARDHVPTPLEKETSP